MNCAGNDPKRLYSELLDLKRRLRNLERYQHSDAHGGSDDVGDSFA